MRILVTGSEGFLGKVLCRQLRSDSHEVIGYDIANGKDILDNVQLREAMIDCDVCIHLAAIADLYIAEHQPELARNLNINATNRCLKLLNNWSQSIIHLDCLCLW